MKNRKSTVVLFHMILSILEFWFLNFKTNSQQNITTCRFDVGTCII
jgi:hypothetical protein